MRYLIIQLSCLRIVLSQPHQTNDPDEPAESTVLADHAKPSCTHDATGANLGTGVPFLIDTDLDGSAIIAGKNQADPMPLEEAEFLDTPQIVVGDRAAPSNVNLAMPELSESSMQAPLPLLRPLSTSPDSAAGLLIKPMMMPKSLAAAAGGHTAFK